MRNPWTLALRFARNLKAWPWTRCAHCGLRLPWGYEPAQRPGDAGPPRPYHQACDGLLTARALLKNRETTIAKQTAALTEGYAVAGGLCATLHSRLTPQPGIGPVTRRDATLQLRRAYVWMQENAAAVDVAIRETDSGPMRQIKSVAAQYQREFQKHRQEVQ